VALPVSRGSAPNRRRTTTSTVPARRDDATVQARRVRRARTVAEWHRRSSARGLRTQRLARWHNFAPVCQRLGRLRVRSFHNSKPAVAASEATLSQSRTLLTTDELFENEAVARSLRANEPSWWSDRCCEQLVATMSSFGSVLAVPSAPHDMDRGAGSSSPVVHPRNRKISYSIPGSTWSRWTAARSEKTDFMFVRYDRRR